MNQMCVFSYRQRERERERDCVVCVYLREKEGEKKTILEKNLYVCI